MYGGLYGRHYNPQEIENFINSGVPSLEQVLLADNLDNFFKTENEVVMK